MRAIWDCASLFASCSEESLRALQPDTENSNRQSKSINVAMAMSFPPSERTVNRMRTFLPIRKVRGRRGASSSSPYHAYACLLRGAPGGARADLMGKRSHENLDAHYKPLVEVDLLARTHPAFH